MIRNLILAATLAATPFAALAQDAIFPTRDAARELMVELLGTRQIVEVMLAFGGSDEMTPERLRDLEMRVQSLYPRDFSHHVLVRQQELENGWVQEMHAFYNDVDYIYAYLLMHEREDDVAAVNFKFNSDFTVIFSEF